MYEEYKVNRDTRYNQHSIQFYSLSKVMLTRHIVYIFGKDITVWNLHAKN